MVGRLTRNRERIIEECIGVYEYEPTEDQINLMLCECAPVNNIIQRPTGFGNEAKSYNSLWHKLCPPALRKQASIYRKGMHNLIVIKNDNNDTVKELGKEIKKWIEEFHENRYKYSSAVAKIFWGHHMPKSSRPETLMSAHFTGSNKQFFIALAKSILTGKRIEKLFKDLLSEELLNVNSATGLRDSIRICGAMTYAGDALTARLASPVHLGVYHSSKWFKNKSIVEVAKSGTGNISSAESVKDFEPVTRHPPRQVGYDEKKLHGCGNGSNWLLFYATKKFKSKEYIEDTDSEDDTKIKSSSPTITIDLDSHPSDENDKFVAPSQTAPRDKNDRSKTCDKSGKSSASTDQLGVKVWGRKKSVVGAPVPLKQQQPKQLHPAFTSTPHPKVALIDVNTVRDKATSTTVKGNEPSRDNLERENSADDFWSASPTDPGREINERRDKSCNYKSKSKS
uniref:Uncharacterized protein n=1 Tax=Trichogramma kaykai TaxID=54128 RepID=A0ABD2W712_9HYME